MARLQKKFIVLANKDIISNLNNTFMADTTKRLINALNEYNELVELASGKGKGKKFYVCNQDEPYAAFVIKTILHGEEQKEKDLVKPKE